MPRRCLLASVSLLAIALAAGLAAAADTPTAILERAGIAPTAAGVRQYLESLVEDMPAADVDRLIADLGHDKYEVRERASRDLARLGKAAEAKLAAAAKGPDAEAAFRAKVLLKRLSQPLDSPLTAALALVKQEKLEVGLPLLVKVHAQAPNAQAQEAAVQAMLAIVQASDRALALGLSEQDNAAVRSAGRRLLARLDAPDAPPLESTVEAVRVQPGSVAGGGPNLICGWEFRLSEDVTVTHVGIYDSGRDGLATEHAIAIWDVEDRSAAVVQETVAAGAAVPLTGVFRYVSVTPTRLAAGKRYAIVAHYENASDSTVSMTNPSGLTLDYAKPIEPLGRRYAFPHKAMAFPSHLSEGAKHCSIGPSFRYLSGER